MKFAAFCLALFAIIACAKTAPTTVSPDEAVKEALKFADAYVQKYNEQNGVKIVLDKEKLETLYRTEIKLMESSSNLFQQLVKDVKPLSEAFEKSLENFAKGFKETAKNLNSPDTQKAAKEVDKEITLFFSDYYKYFESTMKKSGHELPEFTKKFVEDFSNIVENLKKKGSQLVTEVETELENKGKLSH